MTDRARRLRKAITALEEEERNPSIREVEEQMFLLVQDLLASDGYAGRRNVNLDGHQLDGVFERPADSRHAAVVVGVEFRYTRLKVDAATVRSFYPASIGLDRMIVFSASSFTKAARFVAEAMKAPDVELLDLQDLRAWTDRLASSDDAIGLEVERFVREMSRSLALMIAKSPEALEHVEWRDLERILAEVFDALGFGVTLTPPSKDGGKDVILECTVDGALCSYVVEVKHWRSGKRAGGGILRDFLKVIVRERRDGGLFLSSHGLSETAYQQLTEVDRMRLRTGDGEKIVALCQSYSKAQSGIWAPPPRLPDLLYEGTG